MPATPRCSIDAAVRLCHRTAHCQVQWCSLTALRYRSTRATSLPGSLQVLVDGA